MKARRIIETVLARGNEFWQDPAGKLHRADPDHVGWANDYLYRKNVVPVGKLDYLGDYDYDIHHQETYRLMYKLGWLRVYIDRGDEVIWVQTFNTRSIPERQISSLIKYAIEKGYTVKQDTNNLSRPARTIYTPPEPDWSEWD